MYQILQDSNGAIHFIDADGRNAPPPRAESGRRRRRQDIFFHHGPAFPPMVPANPHAQPIPYYGPAYPAQPVTQPVAQPVAQPARSIDMRTALDAIGVLLPAAGKMIAAFRHAPEKPNLTGQPEKDLAALMEYVSETFDHQRSGAQTSSVLATTGAVMEILAAL